MLNRKLAFVSSMTSAIWEELSGRKIEISNPQRDLHVRSAEGLSADWIEGGLGTEPANSSDRKEKQQ